MLSNMLRNFLLPILLEDANTISGFIYNFAIEFTGGDWIFIGVLIMGLLAFILAISGVRSGGVIAVFAAFAFVLSLFWVGFIFLFWLAFIVAVFILIMAFRKKATGQ